VRLDREEIDALSYALDGLGLPVIEYPFASGGDIGMPLLPLTMR